MIRDFFIVLTCLFPGVSITAAAAWQGQGTSERAEIHADTTAAKVHLTTAGELTAKDVLQAVQLSTSRPETTMSLDDLCKKILNHIARSGFMQARIDSSRKLAGPPAAYYIHLTSGPRFQLTTLDFSIPDSLRSYSFLKKMRRVKSITHFKNDVQRALDEFGEIGFPFAAIKIDSAHLHNDKDAHYGLRVRLQPGPQMRIDSISVSGNSATRSEVVMRFLAMKPGILYRESQIRAIPATLMRTGLFTAVAQPELVVDHTGGGHLKVEIKEGKNNAFNGILGYNPPSGSEPGFLTGLVDVGFNNLFGTGRQLAVHWQRKGRTTQELALSFKEPWFLGSQLGLSGSFSQLFQDTLFVERRLRLNAEWPVTPSLFLIGQIDRVAISPDSLTQSSVPSSIATASGFGIRFDSTDDPLNPGRGLSWYTLFQPVTKKETGPAAKSGAASFKQQRFLVDLNMYKGLWGYHVLSLGAHWRQLTGTALNPLTDTFRFGGATTLRGYREEQFRGSRVLWANLEWRYLLSSTSRAFVFFDFGQFYREEQLQKMEIRKQAFGFGFRLTTGLGLIGFDYGLGEGDNMLGGKIHVQLINSF